MKPVSCSLVTIPVPDKKTFMAASVEWDEKHEYANVLGRTVKVRLEDDADAHEFWAFGGHEAHSSYHIVLETETGLERFHETMHEGTEGPWWERTKERPWGRPSELVELETSVRELAWQDTIFSSILKTGTSKETA